MAETIRCAACGRECEPINDSDAPVTHCVDCAPSPTYHMTTVRDFLAVPEDRIDACLRDFAVFLKSSPHWASLLGKVSDEMHGPGAVTFVVGERFTWIDDDDHNMSFKVLTPDGEATDVLTLTPDDADAIYRNLTALRPSPPEGPQE